MEDRTKNLKKKSEKKQITAGILKDSVNGEKNNWCSPVGEEATEPDMKQLIGSKLGKEYNKTVCCILLI